MNDDPTTYDAPEPTAPRRYVLSGSPAICGKCRHPMHWHECGGGAVSQMGPCRCRNDESRIASLGRGSVALAVLGEMLTELEAEPVTGVARLIRLGKVRVLQAARDRVAAAEAAL